MKTPQRQPIYEVIGSNLTAGSFKQKLQFHRFADAVKTQIQHGGVIYRIQDGAVLTHRGFVQVSP